MDRFKIKQQKLIEASKAKEEKLLAKQVERAEELEKLAPHYKLMQ